jgi:acetyl esterase
MLDGMQARGGPPLHTLPVAEVRAMAAAGARTATPPPPVARVVDDVLPGPAGDLPVRLYTPEGAEPFPALVYCHGGGWVLPSFAHHDRLCRQLCRGAACVVVAVDYRLAPEHPFPAATDDCLAATRGAARCAAEFGVDPTRIAVAGDSSGGALAAATARRIRDEGGPPLRGQLLLCPATDYHTPATPSALEYAEGYLMTRAQLMWFWGHYLTDESEADNPDASPLRAPDLRGLPPALVITAEYDVLRDEGERYAERLRAAGVPTAHSRYPGMIHGFFTMFGVLDQAQQAVDEASAWLRATLSR